MSCRRYIWNGDEFGIVTIRRNFLSIVGNKKGAAAVEFALVAPLFFAMTFSILEAGWFFFVNSVVEQANSNAARLIRTGQAQNDSMSKTAFYDTICNIVKPLGSCDEKLTIDVTAYNSFADLAADVSAPVCRDKDDTTIEGAQFDPTDYGAQRQIVRVRVCYLYKPVTPALGLNLGKTKHGDREVISVSIFRNEPFES